MLALMPYVLNISLACWLFCADARKVGVVSELVLAVLNTNVSSDH